MDAQQIIDLMIKEYGDSIADPEVFPKVFAHQVRMVVHSLKLQEHT